MTDLEKYVLEHTTPQDEVLEWVERETHLRTVHPRMLSAQPYGDFLAFIAKLMQPSAVLEIGTFTGYSALCFAKGLAQGGVLDTIEVNDEMQPLIGEAFEKAGYSQNTSQHNPLQHNESRQIETQPNPLQQNESQQDVLQQDAPQQNTLQHNILQHNALQHNELRQIETQPNPLQQNESQNTLQHNILQYNPLQHNPLQHNESRQIETRPNALRPNESQPNVTRWTNAQNQTQINLHIGSAVDIIPTLNRQYDLVFIDGDKREYKEYYKLVKPLTHKGSIIIADNVLWDGKVVGVAISDGLSSEKGLWGKGADSQNASTTQNNTQKVRCNDAQTLGVMEFNDYVQADNTVRNFLLPLGDGLMVIEV